MLSILFIALAGICNAVMDIIQFKFSISIFNKYTDLKQWADPKLSWRNKWKNGDPKQGENFPGSSTMFVWTTDLWHFAQSFMITFFCLAIVFYEPFWPFPQGNLDLLLDLFILKFTFSISFEVFWSKILR